MEKVVSKIRVLINNCQGTTFVVRVFVDICNTFTCTVRVKCTIITTEYDSLTETHSLACSVTFLDVSWRDKSPDFILL